MVGSIIAAAVGVVASAYGNYMSNMAQQQQLKAQAASMDAQSKMARYQAQVAEQNAELAADQGRQAKKEGFENKLKKRQEVAMTIASQRAQQGASGATVDVGSMLDVNMDTAATGESDALALEQQGLNKDYQARMEAWNYQNQAAANYANSNYYASTASYYKSQAAGINPLLSAVTTLATGMGQVGANYYTMTKNQNYGTTASTVSSGAGAVSKIGK